MPVEVDAERVYSLRGGSRIAFRNPRGLKRYYVIYHNKTTPDYYIYYAYSSDGVSWSEPQQIASSSTYWQGGWDAYIYDDGSQLRVFVSFSDDDGGLKYRRGTITDASSTISWDTEQTIASLTRGQADPLNTIISRTHNGRLVILTFHDKSAPVTGYVRTVRIYGADGDGASPSWTLEELHDYSSDQDAADKDSVWGGIAKFSSSYPNRIAVVYRAPDEGVATYYEGHVEVLDWNGSSWSTIDTDEITPSSVGMCNYISVIVDDSDKVHVLYRDSTNNCKHKAYPTAGGLGTETEYTVASATDEFGSITIDRTRDILYAFYRPITPSAEIRWKTTSTGTISWGIEKTIGFQATVTDLSTSREPIEGSIHICVDYSNNTVYYHELSLTHIVNGYMAHGRGGERAVFRNPRGNKRYYMFYIDDDDATYTSLCYAWNDNPDIEAWSTHIIAASSTYPTRAINACYYDTGSLLSIYLGYITDFTSNINYLQYRKCSIADSDNTVTVGTPQTVDSNVGFYLTEEHACAITRTNSGYPVIIFTEDKVVDSRNHRYVQAYGADADSNSPSWTLETIDDESAYANNEDKDEIPVGIEAFDSSYPNRVCMYMRSPASITTTRYDVYLAVKDWNGTSWSAVAAGSVGATGDNTGKFVSCVIDDDDKVNIVWFDDTTTDRIRHAKYDNAGTLGTSTAYTVKETTGVDFGSLSIDRTNDDLYAYYHEGSETQIHYKTTPVSSISWSSEQTLDTGSVQPTGISTSTEDIESAIHILYEGASIYYYTEGGEEEKTKTFTVDAHIAGGAVVHVEEWNTATPTYTDVSTIIMCTTDSATPSVNYPVKIPSAGNNYSYWKHVGLYIEGDYTAVSNIRLYCDGTIGWNYGTGGELRIGARDSGDYGCPSGSYDQASGSEGTTGDDLETSHSYYSGQTNKSDDMETFTSGSPATIDTTTYTTNGVRSKAAVLQVKLATDATLGLQSTETLTWLYDEV